MIKFPSMTTFEARKTYFFRYICDADSRVEIKIERRTAKSVWITGDGYTHERRAIKIDDSGTEFIFPEGRYSMAPVLRASRPA